MGEKWLDLIDYRVLDLIDYRVRKNLGARGLMVDRAAALGMVSDVLDALSKVGWPAKREAALCESEWEELLDRNSGAPERK